MSVQHRSAHDFPADPWCIRETAHTPSCQLLHETLFALGNGYIGLRGSHEEGRAGPAGASHDASYLNGFFESETIAYPEGAFGLAKTNQFLLNVPNAKCIELWLDGERLDLSQGELSAYERSLDFRTGILQRKLEWTSPGGKRVAISSRRLVCFDHKHLFAIEYAVTPLNFSGPLRLLSWIDGDVRNLPPGADPRAGTADSGPLLELLGIEQGASFSAITQRTRNSGFTLVSAIDSEVHADGAVRAAALCEGQQAGHSFEVDGTPSGTVRLTKFGCYFSSRDFPEAELAARSRDTLALAKAAGFDALCARQARYLAEFWSRADVEIAGDDMLQQGMRFNQFHLLQSVGRDGKTNIAAKGVTGEGYDGHYFWDTEIYVFPFLLYCKPEIARTLLEYRFRGLASARERARQMAHVKGALYPWRTIAGEECSAYFPAGTAQYHINADIAYSIKLYYEATGDLGYMAQAGAEIVFDTARIWLDIGHYDREGRFCINEVTGPDEYTALVNNNYYTNAMARMHLRFAADLIDTIRRERPEAFARIAQVTGFEDGEPDAMRRAADHMALPYDAALGVHPQDDSFLSKKPWDFAATPADKYPLLLNYHPLVIYRHQVCKQADVVLALLLLSDEFTLADKRRDFDYYEALTTHDSSLSACIFGIVAAEVGYAGKAYDYFMETARLDLDDTHGNTQHGVHTAAMAGTWLGVAYGFGGMRVAGGALSFAPRLPAQWRHYRFRIHIRGALLQVRVERGEVEYTLLEGAGLSFMHRGERIDLRSAAPVARAATEPTA